MRGGGREAQPTWGDGSCGWVDGARGRPPGHRLAVPWRPRRHQKGAAQRAQEGPSQEVEGQGRPMGGWLGRTQRGHAHDNLAARPLALLVRERRLCSQRTAAHTRYHTWGITCTPLSPCPVKPVGTPQQMGAWPSSICVVSSDAAGFDLSCSLPSSCPWHSVTHIVLHAPTDPHPFSTGRKTRRPLQTHIMALAWRRLGAGGGSKRLLLGTAAGRRSPSAAAAVYGGQWQRLSSLAPAATPFPSLVISAKEITARYVG